MSTPLGLLVGFQASPEAVEKLQFIEDWDLSPVIDAARRANPGLVAGVELETKRFLALPILFPARQAELRPSLPIDDVWHQFLLHTQSYHDFCGTAYGGYLHHAPDQEIGPSGHYDSAHRATVEDEMPATLSLYQDAFGTPDQTVWAGIAWCGPCGTT